MRERFEDKNFTAATLAIIELANGIIGEYQRQGFMLTLRQLYYQFVARDLLPNSQKSYNKLGNIISNGRLAGLIDWAAIEDRTRNLDALATWDSPEEIIESAANAFRSDLWANQEYYPEVWIEKEALVGVIERACIAYRVPFMACRGYMSQSEQYAAGKRFYQAAKDGRKPVVFHLGDHDPSGIDMTRDNNDRLDMFTYFKGVDLRRLALNRDQIEEYDPPPNPAKMTDSRFEAYLDEYGEESWELDALEPRVIDRLIRDNIESIMDHDKWNEDKEAEEATKDTIRAVGERWEEVRDFLDREEEE